MKPRTLLSAEEGACIVKLRRKGLTMQAICKRTGRSMHAVRRALRSAGIQRYRVAEPNPKLSYRCTRIVTLARQGLSQEDVAKQLNITLPALVNLLDHYLLKDHGEPLMGTQELAARIGMSQKSVLLAIGAGQVEHSWWFTRYVFTPAQVAVVEQQYAQYLEAAEIADWLSTEQTARELGLTPDQLRRRVRTQGAEALGLRRVRVIGTPGRVFRYDPRSVLKVAQQGRGA